MFYNNNAADKSKKTTNNSVVTFIKSFKVTNLLFYYYIIGKGPQTFSTVFTRIAGDFGLVAQNPLTENGLLFKILSSSAVPV